MNIGRRALALLAAGSCTAAFAAEDEIPAWEFGITAYPTSVRGGRDYTSAIAVADRGPLHLETRFNYESIGTRSAFVGWTFSGGDAVTWKLTPLLGGAWGDTRAFVPGFETSIGWGRLDLYVEAEYVRSSVSHDDSYFYTWNELGYRPVEWFRFGISSQRTRAPGNGLDIQRGPFAQLIWGRVTIGGYWFNPGSNEQVFVGSINATF